MPAARLTVREMPAELAASTDAERAQRSRLAIIYQSTNPRAALSADELVVFLAEAPPGAEQGALDDLSRHAHSPADLVVGEAVELTQDEYAVMAFRETTERAAEVVKPLLALNREVGRFVAT
jgi:hypothetical protein